MTTAASKIAEPAQLVARQGATLSRESIFGWAFLILTANAGMTTAAEAVRGMGFFPALFNLFNVSAIVWAAAAAGAALMFEVRGNNKLHRLDVALLVLVAIAALSPFPPASAVAATGLAGWLVLTSQPGSNLRRGTLIFAAIMANFLWGRLVLLFGSEYFLAVDGYLVGLIAGTGGQGNMVNFEGGGAFVVATGCSSVQGISLALVLWVAVTQFFKVPLDARAWWTLVASLVAAIVINVTRMAAMALMPEHFEWLHEGFGSTMFGWAGLAAIMLVTWIGLRHALATRD